ncbi:hypothetical protein OG350_04715 [Streptomyces achromogenes]|uniref:Uncharacterized protein n=1 Tax=Streptomyces achromogenes TaxID=67255 RepID=A0ABZ1KJV1_STRAH
MAGDPALPGELVTTPKTPKTPEGPRFSELKRPHRRALERVGEIGAYLPGRLNLSRIPPNRMAAPARYAL